MARINDSWTAILYISVPVHIYVGYTFSTGMCLIMSDNREPCIREHFLNF